MKTQKLKFKATKVLKLANNDQKTNYKRFIKNITTKQILYIFVT